MGWSTEKILVRGAPFRSNHSKSLGFIPDPILKSDSGSHGNLGLALFAWIKLLEWDPPSADTWRCPDNYVQERKKVDVETRQLAALFEEALKLPAVSGIAASVECPLCGTKLALTSERVKVIRRHVEEIRDFKTAEKAARSALTELLASAKVLKGAVEAALPKHLTTKAEERRRTGFTVARIHELIGDRATLLVAHRAAERVRPCPLTLGVFRRSVG